MSQTPAYAPPTHIPTVAVDTTRIIDSIPERKVPTLVTGIAVVFILFGLVGFGYGLMVDKAWAWGSFLVGLLYTMAIAQGGIVFSVVGTLTWAHWSRPIKRVAESFAFWLPFAFVGLVFFLLFGLGLYPWNPDTFVGKPVDITVHNAAVMFSAKPIWLSRGFFTLRMILAVGFLFTLDLAYLRATLRPDLIMAKARLGDRAPAWWGWLTGGARDLAAEVEAGQNLQSTLSPFIALAYGYVISMVAFDLVMSLSPLWYSNLFGAWYFSNSVLLSMAWLAFTSMIAMDWLGLKGWIKTKTTHDLGKLMLAFTMAYGYMLFGQLLPIWYANEPEETQFILVRLGLPQWEGLAHFTIVMCFIAPFVMLTSRGMKKIRYAFAGLATVIMIGIFLDRTLLVMPSVYFGDTFPYDLFFITSVGVWLGFVGAFILVVGNALARLPTLVISDPRLPDHPWDAHIHSLDAHTDTH